MSTRGESADVVMTSREIEEYRALRATIRERSTARVWVALVGVLGWALSWMAEAQFLQVPLATLVPLLVLALTFELVYSIHVAVERVGRYIQVFFEGEDDDGGWERHAMEYGRRFPGGGLDPLYCAVFWGATVLNLLPLLIVTPRPGSIESGLVGAAHVAFAARVLWARRRAAGQRARDLERFTQLKGVR